MANRSSKFAYSPEARQRLETQLLFIQEHRDQNLGLARSVADAIDCSVSNVYSVFTKRSFNAEIIRESYNQLCRIMGIIDHNELVSSNEDDELGLRYLAESQNLTERLQEAMKTLSSAQAGVKRIRKDLLRLRMGIEAHMSVSLEDMSDEISVRLRAYLDSLPSYVGYDIASHAIDVEEYTPEFLAGMKLLAEYGLTGENGSALQPEEALALVGSPKFTPDGPEVDPMAPGRHVDAEGEEYYISG